MKKLVYNGNMQGIRLIWPVIAVMKNEAIGGIDDFYTKKIKKIPLRSILRCPEDMPIFEVARVMAHDKISCVLL